MIDPQESCVSEEYAAREQVRKWRLRLGMRWFAAVLLIALLLGVMLGRLINGPPPLPDFLFSSSSLLAVHSRALEDGLELRLEFDRHTSVEVQRLETLQRLNFGKTQLRAEQVAGRAAGVGWRVTEQDGQLQLVLLGLRQRPEIALHPEYVEGRWWLNIEARLAKAE